MAPPYKLTYFSIKALGEPIRWILSYSDIEFEDNRIKEEQWPMIKPNMPFGKVPVLEVDGKKLHQSMALTRYFGRKVGLAGKDEWEDLQIEMAVGSVDDFRESIARWNYEADEGAKAKKHDPLFNEIVPFFLERFDKQIKDNGGYLANGKLSWGDIYFVSIIDYLNFMLQLNITEKHANIKALHDKVVEIPKIKAWIQKRPDSEC